MVFLYLIATIFISISSYYFLDLPIALFASLSPSYLIFISFIITTLATPFSHLFLWGGLSFLGWTRKWNKEFTYKAFQLFFICSFILFLAGILKISVARARPELFLNNGIYGFCFGCSGNQYRSFPSSHTAIAFGLAWFWKIFSSKKIFYPYVLASIIGLSRILTNQHYISDVFTGAFIGIFTATWIYSLTEKHKPLIINLLGNFRYN
jgi:membrane-associated phospholipid phosphatase